MANLQELRNLTVRRIRDEGFTALVNDTDYTDAVNEARNMLAEIIKQTFNRYIISSISGERTYYFPQDYMSLYDDNTIFYRDANNAIHRVQLCSYEFVKDNEDLNTRTGTPTVFWISGNTFNFYPIPDYNGTGNIYFDYYSYPNRLVNLNDECNLPDKYKQVISYFAASLICEWYEDYEQQKIMYNRGLLRLNSLQNTSDIVLNEKNITYIGGNYFGS